MKKKILYTLIIVMSFFMFGKVNAEELGACSVTDLAKLRQAAANVKVTYVAQIIYEEDAPHRYFDIKIFNLPSEVYGTLKMSGSRVKANQKEFSYANKGPDGSVTFRQPVVNVTVDYNIDIFSNKDNCTGDLIRSFKLTLPKFNQYSELRACEDIPEFYMCQEYITFDIDGSRFYDAVDAYKKKTAENSEIPTLEKVYYAKDPIVDGISKYKYLIVGGVLLIAVGATYYIINRKKKEVK